MSEYEKINAGVKLSMSSRRTEAIKRIVLELVKVLVAIAACIGLKAIGFISAMFLVILVAIIVCVGAFKSGYICRDIKF